MDFGSMLDDSFAYAKEGVWGRWSRWLILIACFVIFPFILGYVVRIYRGETPAMEPGAWGSMFTDGLKLLLVQILYFLPVILLIILAFIPVVSTFVASGALSEDFSAMSDTQSERWIEGHPEILSSLGIMVVLLFLACILALVITVFSYLGTVRFARTGSIREAFDFSSILAIIGRIGWFNYIIALIVITVIGFIFSTIIGFCEVIPMFGIFLEIIVMVILYVPFIMFSARFASLVYDAGEEPLPAGQDAMAIPTVVK